MRRNTVAASLCWAATALLVAVPGWAGEIDFDSGFQPGETIDMVYNGKGAQGLPNGHITVFGFLPSLGSGFNAAIIFDSDCGGPPYLPENCSGDAPAMASEMTPISEPRTRPSVVRAAASEGLPAPS